MIQIHLLTPVPVDCLEKSGDGIPYARRNGFKASVGMSGHAAD